MVENVADLMAARLNPQTLAAAWAVGAAAQAEEVQPFLVGGSVRDLLIDRAEIVDLDIALVGAGNQTFDRIAAYTSGTASKRSQFTTAKLLIGDLEIDLAMARDEGYPAPGSLPVVRSSTLQDDLARRDFTVNAMAVSLQSATWGDLFDLHGGQTDLDQRLLRILHPGSFGDDPTRILRAARYSSRLGLTPTPDTLDALLSSVNYLDEVSPARVRNELERTFVESNPAGAMRLLSEWGVLTAIHPSVRFQAEAWARFDCETVGVSHRKKIGVAYAVLGYGLSDFDANMVVARLDPDASARRSVNESAMLGRMAESEMRCYAASQFAELLDPLAETAVLGASLAGPEELGSRLAEYLRAHRHFRPRLTGNDLITMGVRQGPEVGRVLELLRDAWLDGEVSTPDDELALAERLIARISAS